MTQQFNYGNEILNNAYDKYFKKQKVTYQEFVLMLSTNDELEFYCKDLKFQIIYESKNIVAMYVTKYNEKEKVSLDITRFNSLKELLDKFKIDGKTIKEIWYKVTFD